jgi:hypothetical protein
MDSVSIAEFNKLSLERRTQLILRDYFFDETNIIVKEGEIGVKAKPFLESWAYAEKNKYVELAGGTSKSRPRYKYTSEGLNFMNKSPLELQGKVSM